MKNSVVALVREKNVIVINNEDNKKNDSNKMNKKKTVIYDQSFFMFDSESWINLQLLQLQPYP